MPALDKTNQNSDEVRLSFGPNNKQTKKKKSKTSQDKFRRWAAGEARRFDYPLLLLYAWRSGATNSISLLLGKMGVSQC